MSKSAPVTPVESIIRRAKGSTVILDGREYRFIANPDFDGAHVVEMDDPAHVSRLLRHPEGWRIYGDKTVSAPPKPAASGVGYAVQLGAFSNAGDANALRDRVRAAGFSAFVEQVRTDKGTLNRVRVGPVADRAGADRLKAQVASKVGIDGMVRPHP